MKKTGLGWFLVGAITVVGIAKAEVIIQDEIRTYTSLANETVYMTGRSELRLNGSTPLSNCQVHLNSPDAWVFFYAVKPSAVNAAYLNQIRVNGTAAVLDSNVRIVQYVTGAVVIPHGPGVQPLQVFSGPAFTGPSMKMGLYTYYRTEQLGAMNNAVSSFRLKRGYMATFAQEANGAGISRVYIAKDNDLDIDIMPPDLNNTVSFVRVFPWRWASQKGMAGGSNENGTTLNCSWRYDWNNEAQSTLDIEYVPMRHGRWWPSYDTNNNKQNVTHVLGFNEPDSAEQANMTVAEVISEWPNLLASGLRLGSPATTDGGLNWLYSFIDQADALNYRVDFVAVHYYQNNWTAGQMYNWLRNIHLRTGRPLWITEWNNGCNWTTPHPTYQQNATKINELITMLAATPFVERYSFYQWCTNRELFYSDGSLTPAGVVYRDHVSPMANALDTNKDYVGYYRLDETGGTTAADLSGKDAHATLKNGQSFNNNSVTGKVGRALRFDGVDDCIQLPAGYDKLDNGFSVTLWAYPTAVKNWARFIDLGSGPNNNNIVVAREAQTNTLIVQGFSGTAGGSYVRAANAIALNAWQFFAVTVDNRGNVRIYKNGQLLQSGATTAPPSVWRTANYIGRSNWAADAYYQGDMDDFRIFNYALTANEVTALYTIDTSMRPYGGTPAVIPGRIEAERFDLGNENVGFHDTTFGNSGGQFRPDEDVDIRAVTDSGAGYAVTGIASGEWLRYTVNITETAAYCLYFRASAAADTLPVTVKLNGTVIAAVPVSSTGSADTFRTFVVNDLSLSAGNNQTLRLDFPAGGLDVNWIQFEKQGPWGGQVKTIPGKVEAEEFDIGASGVTYYDTTNGNAGGQFRTAEDVDIVGIADAGAGYAIDAIETGEWLRYTVSSDAAQTEVYARVASTQAGGQIRVLLDNVLLATIAVPDTGSLTNWQTVSASGLTLPQRQNAALTLEFVGAGIRLNWIHFQNQMPYLGVPTAIPGRLEFENYDIGGQLISFYDKTATNGYKAYRPNEPVDIMNFTDSGAGYALWTESTEWLEYTCAIEPGTYTISVRSSSPYAAQQLTLSQGEQTAATFTLPNSGGYDKWRDTILTNVTLAGGADQVLRFSLGNSTSVLNYVDFIRQYNPADISRDGRVDMDDAAILAAQWLSAPGQPSADIAPIGGDGAVNPLDLLTLAENWMASE